MKTARITAYSYKFYGLNNSCVITYLGELYHIALDRGRLLLEDIPHDSCLLVQDVAAAFTRQHIAHAACLHASALHVHFTIRTESSGCESKRTSISLSVSVIKYTHMSTTLAKSFMPTRNNL